MPKRLKIKKSPNVKHDLRGVKFAYQFARARAQSWGKKLDGCEARITSTNCGYWGFCGRAWKYQRRVLLRLGKHLPPHLHVYPRFKEMPTFWLWGGDESIVYLAAHEFGHLIGWGHGKHAEIAACKFGYEAVEAWRSEQYDHPACLI